MPGPACIHAMQAGPGRWGTLPACTRYHNMADERDREAMDAYSAAVTTVVQRVLPSVASLRVRSRLGEGAGSASVLTTDGFMLTSAHVVEGSSAVIASFANGTETTADVVGKDAFSDLAVLRASLSSRSAIRSAWPEASQPASFRL
jgi:S1-C subfamily serine protease